MGLGLGHHPLGTPVPDPTVLCPGGGHTPSPCSPQCLTHSVRFRGWGTQAPGSPSTQPHFTLLWGTRYLAPECGCGGVWPSSLSPPPPPALPGRFAVLTVGSNAAAPGDGCCVPPPAMSAARSPPSPTESPRVPRSPQPCLWPPPHPSSEHLRGLHELAPQLRSTAQPSAGTAGVSSPPSLELSSGISHGDFIPRGRDSSVRGDRRGPAPSGAAAAAGERVTARAPLLLVLTCFLCPSVRPPTTV